MPCKYRAFFYCLSFFTASGFSGFLSFGGGGGGTSFLSTNTFGGGGGAISSASTILGGKGAGGGGGGTSLTATTAGFGAGEGGGNFVFPVCAIPYNEAMANIASNISFLFMQVGLY